MSSHISTLKTHVSTDHLFSFAIDSVAEKYLMNVCSAPYLKVSVKKGGCSGSMYAIEEVQTANSEREYIFALSEQLSIIVPKVEAVETLKSLVCNGVDHSSGFMIKWSHAISGSVCGCGESFE